VNLSKAEIEDITVPGYWLESSHINAAINLIKHQFPNIGGLYDTTLGWDLEFPAAPSEKWIQIIHDGKGHWVVASKSKGEDSVSIYDSLGGSSVNEHIIGCISSLLRTNRKTFEYQSVGCQQQLPNDCGLHAIANAITLAWGEDPSQSLYNRGFMRQHLKKCLLSKVMSAFPKSDLKREKIMSVSKQFKKVRVYCSCQRIDYQPLNSTRTQAWHTIECTGCKEWFHRMCESWPPKSTRGAWLCKQCKGVY
jgi:hypothetical protein